MSNYKERFGRGAGKSQYIRELTTLQKASKAYPDLWHRYICLIYGVDTPPKNILITQAQAGLAVEGSTGEFDANDTVKLRVDDAYGKTYEKQVPGWIMNNPQFRDKAEQAFRDSVYATLDRQLKDEQFEKKVKKTVKEVIEELS